MQDKYKIYKINKKSQYLEVIWNDNHISKYHFIWLRDNCPSAFHKDTKMRNFNILTIPNDINPIEFKNLDKILNLKWSVNNHISNYDLKWLRNNCYTEKNLKKYKSPYTLWDKKFVNNIKKVTFEHDVILKNDKQFKNWLNTIYSYGFAIVENAPIESNSAFNILNKIGDHRETFFGTPFEVINISKPNNSAYTAHALRNHMDLPWFENPPGYQFLHCLINNADGGNSSAVDAFAVADYLRRNEKEIFEILVNVPLKFRDKDYTQESHRSFYGSAISLTKDGDYNDIRFSVATMDALDCHPDIMDKVYKAHHRFGNLLHDDKFQINFRLEPGDIFSFNNRRILHGRTAFNPNSGDRHLQGYYMDRDEIIGRLNYLKK